MAGRSSATQQPARSSRPVWQPETTLRFGWRPLRRFWYLKSYLPEGGRRLEDALYATPPDPAVRAGAARRGGDGVNSGDAATASSALKRCAELTGRRCGARRRIHARNSFRRPRVVSSCSRRVRTFSTPATTTDAACRANLARTVEDRERERRTRQLACRARDRQSPHRGKTLGACNIAFEEVGSTTRWDAVEVPSTRASVIARHRHRSLSRCVALRRSSRLPRCGPSPASGLRKTSARGTRLRSERRDARRDPRATRRRGLCQSMGAGSPIDVRRSARLCPDRAFLNARSSRVSPALAPGCSLDSPAGSHPRPRRRREMKKYLVLAAAVALVLPLAALSASSPRSGALHVTKECSAYTGLAGAHARSRPNITDQGRIKGRLRLRRSVIRPASGQ